MDRSTRHQARWFIVGGLALLTGGVAGAQTAQELHLRSLAATCANCHGTEGRAVPGTDLPSLAQLPREYIVAQMQAFRDGKRPATVMHQLAKGYSNQQIDALAGYFAGLK